MDEIYKIPEKYKLVYLNVTCGKAMTAMLNGN